MPVDGADIHAALTWCAEHCAYANEGVHRIRGDFSEVIVEPAPPGGDWHMWFLWSQNLPPYPPDGVYDCYLLELEEMVGTFEFTSAYVESLHGWSTRAGLHIAPWHVHFGHLRDVCEVYEPDSEPWAQLAVDRWQEHLEELAVIRHLCGRARYWLRQ